MTRSFLAISSSKSRKLSLNSDIDIDDMSFKFNISKSLLQRSVSKFPEDDFLLRSMKFFLSYFGRRFITIFIELFN